jgi:hypothetical protein
MIINLKDLLLKLLNTESASVVGILLVILAISFFIIYCLYRKIENLNVSHKKEVSEIHEYYNERLKTIHNEYIKALNNHSDELLRVTNANQQMINDLKYVFANR